jgi:hypothetical protein
MIEQQMPFACVQIHEVNFSSGDYIQHTKLLHHECNPH